MNKFFKTLIVPALLMLLAVINAYSAPVAVEVFDTAIEEQVVFTEDFPEDDGYLLAETSGSCGTKLTWNLDSDGTLTISGTGTMYTWRRANLVPWYSSRNLIKNVVIEEGCTTIGRYAFNSCKNLENITIPASVTSVLNESFSGCESLDDVVLPESVTNIGNDAFNGCESLSAIVIPETVTKIGTSAFSGCSSLKSVSIKGVSDVIAENLFYGCSAITSVEISDSVLSIEKSAFDGCEKLTGFEIPSGVTSIGEAAFRGCARIKALTIPEGITNIYDHTFDGCSRLETITLPEGLLHIGYRAFADCGWLEEITLPQSLVSIGKMAFYYNDTLYEVDIPDGVESIGADAFRDCESLVYVTVGKGVTYIAPNAFYSCDELAFITVDSENNKYINDENGILFNKEKTILMQYPSGKTDLSYVVPDGVEMIADGAFASTYYIRSIELPDSVKIIGVSAFYDCYRLAGVKIPKSVESIGRDFIDNTCTIYTDADSYAHNYAANNNYLFFILSGDVILPSRIYLNTTSISVKIGNTWTIQATVAPYFNGYTTLDEVEWATDNNDVASVEDGVIKGVSKGNTNVYATCGNGSISARVSVIVTKPATSIVLDKEKIMLPLGETVIVTATVLPEDASSKYVYWSSDNTGVATVSSGKITSKGFGTATITARTSDGTVRATVEVTVVEYIVGELNCDGVVDMNDAILLLQHSMFPSLYPINYKGSVDFNNDGAVDMNDAVLLLQHSMFPQLYPIG